MNNKTIAAVSTAKASAGISVIRVSGDRAIDISDKIFKSKSGTKLSDMKGYTCALGDVYTGGERIDECIATVFREPHSYTGENVVELSCHGGVYVTAAVLRAVLDAGAQPAQAGEFTKRAFLNGKLDLIEAEAVMDIISSRSKASARAALEIKDGALSERIDGIKAALLDKAAHLNAWADYPEEDIPEISSEELISALTKAEKELDDIIKSYDNGRILKDGIDTVIAGKPNVGKSTLMNLLAGYDKSIVTSVAGTTRDIVEESVTLDDIVLNLSDTAGIRTTGDEIESIGVEKARAKLETAALILCVFDSSKEISDDDNEIINSAADAPSIAIINKTDLPSKLDEEKLKDKFKEIVRMSAKNSDGVRELIEAIKRVYAVSDLDSNLTLIYNERQRSLTINARDCVHEAIEALNIGMTFDAITVSIEEAIAYLCELTGERVTDEVVDRVFHNFCVGK
ncbi:MAG: tRNA uridine-5-carboxymethylaminomethyl(34) synthesis GTPase MnmE [Ruminococcus sp.]|nr:tRNA uridine-5-carboxymethylaminomethyl(34) synthesis GTPase MnmE [Ruminococcus sp.]